MESGADWNTIMSGSSGQFTKGRLPAKVVVPSEDAHMHKLTPSQLATHEMKQDVNQLRDRHLALKSKQGEKPKGLGNSPDTSSYYYMGMGLIIVFLFVLMNRGY